MVAALVALLLQATPLRGDSARCDSLIAASRVDSLPSGLFALARRSDGPPLENAQTRQIVTNVTTAFTPPRPFRLTVFSGPPLSRTLRSIRHDTLAVLRAPTVTGIYRFTATDSGVTAVQVLRASLMPGFDSSAVDAIQTGSIGTMAFRPPVEYDRMTVDVEITSDSAGDARRFVSANFPRMPVIDAAPLPNNPPPEIPVEMKADSLGGEVVLRFVVARDGTPDLSTVELIRATDVRLVRAALVAISKHRFRPASIRGCPVSQQIDYALNFGVFEPPVRH